MESLLRDLRYGIRTLARTPAFSAIVILVMALGIGSTIALFTVVDSVLLKPLPLPDSDRLIRAFEADTVLHFQDNVVAGGTFKSWQDGNRSFQQIALISDDDYNLSSSNGQLPERIQAEIGSWSALPLLGVQPAYGRLFTATDDRWGAPETTILTWGFWKRRYGGDPSILGHTILLDAKPFTVIGILPAWFIYPDPSVQLWTPLYPEAPPQMMERHDSHNFDVIGKLKPGVSLAAAQADLSGISAQERAQFPEGPVFNAANLRPLLEAETRDVKTPLYALFAATGCLLLIACLNIANLLVARSAARRKELAIRSALGGSRGRLIRERVMEAVLLALAGGALGIGFAQIALKWLVHLRPDLPRVDSIHLDAAAILFSAGVAILCGVAAGFAPALGENDQQVLHVLQESSRSVSAGHSSVKLRRTLLSAEVALTVVLLVGAGLLLRSYERLRAVDIGIPTRNVLTMSINLPEAQYGSGLVRSPKKVAFYEQLLERLRAMPGVRDAGLSTVLPGQGHHTDHAITIHEDPPLARGKWLDASVRWVDPGYFHAMRIPLLKGAYFSEDEQLERGNFVIVSESFVRQIMQGRDPLGKHVDDPNTVQPGEKSDSNEIVGVVADVREYPDSPSRPTIYFPLYSGLRNDATLAIRTVSDPRPARAAGHRAARSQPARGRCPLARRGNRQVDTLRKLRRNSAGHLRRTLAGTRRRRPVWCAFLCRYAAPGRNRHPHRARRATRTGFAPHAFGWIKARHPRSCPRTHRQRRHCATHPLAALRNPATGSHRLRPGHIRAAQRRSHRVSHPRMARIAPRSHAGVANRVGDR